MPSVASIHISVSPLGSVTGSRMTGTMAVASRACFWRTSRTWIQIITERPGAPDAFPETSSNPGRGSKPSQRRPFRGYFTRPRKPA